MSVWRNKAIAIAPEIRNSLQDPGVSIYELFSELLDLLEQAHLANDKEKIQKIYEYAEWCHRQEAKELWNAAAVAFYEHLADNEIIFSQLTKWVKKDVYFDVRGLLEHHFPGEKIVELDKYYGWNNRKNANPSR